MGNAYDYVSIPPHIHLIVFSCTAGHEQYILVARKNNKTTTREAVEKHLAEMLPPEQRGLPVRCRELQIW